MLRIVTTILICVPCFTVFISETVNVWQNLNKGSVVFACIYAYENECECASDEQPCANLQRWFVVDLLEPKLFAGLDILRTGQRITISSHVH